MAEARKRVAHGHALQARLHSGSCHWSRAASFPSRAIMLRGEDLALGIAENGHEFRHKFTSLTQAHGMSHPVDSAELPAVRFSRRECDCCAQRSTLWHSLHSQQADEER